MTDDRYKDLTVLSLFVSETPDEETGDYEAYCPETGCASCSETKLGAMRSLLEANSLYLEAYDPNKLDGIGAWSHD